MMRTERSGWPLAWTVRRAAVQLRDDHALGAVDNERAVTRHHRHIAEEHVLLTHILAVLETERGMERLRVGVTVAERLGERILLIAEPVAHEVEHVAAVEARHGEDLVEDRLKTLLLALRGRNIRLEEVIVACRLDLDEIRRCIGILELSEYFAFGFGHGSYLSSFNWKFAKSRANEVR